MLDALNRPDGILGVEVGTVGVFAPDKQFGQFLLVVKPLHGVTLAQYFKAPVLGSGLERHIVAP